jgi:hypothetical protein
MNKLCKRHPAGYKPKTTECIKLNNNERKGLWIRDAAPKGFSVSKKGHLYGQNCPKLILPF